MVSLSVERINAKSPYKVTAVEGKAAVKFATQFGVKYIAGFDLTEVLVTAETYQYFITNVNNIKSPNDPKLKETIIAIISDFFICSERAMLYICDTGDGKQAARNRLFRHWVIDSAESENMANISGSVIDEEGVKNYATLIIRNDHPKLLEIMEEFRQSIKLLNDKPTH